MKHLYEFGDGGFYAAESRESAFRLYEADTAEEPGDDFRRDVPDDELIEVCGESPDDQWDDPRQYQKARALEGKPLLPGPHHVHVYWWLNVTASEWANTLTHGDGHVFGGDF